MRIPIIIISLVIASISSGAMAAGPGVQSQAMFYLNVQFDGNSARTEQTTFGLRLDTVQRRDGAAAAYSHYMHQPAYFDLRLNRYGVTGMYLAGRDVLRPYRINRQNEGEEGYGYEDQVSIMDSIKGTLTDMTSVAPMGVWIGAGLGVGLILGVGD